ncbi:Cthe_2314 family HEPN domain-containing protein [Paenibacillus marinisediminis]
MLRILFGEPPRVDDGEIKQAMDAMDQYVQMVRSQMVKHGDPKQDWCKYEVWTVGLKTSLDELEQSVYASERFAERVTKQYQEEMNESELDDYYRHVYFYKDGFIRVFSVLDKLGTLLNEALNLETDKVKSRFSFYTVVRQMRSKGVTPQLTNRLIELKEQHSDALQRLRKRRNTEIHHMNTEMQDDLWQRHRSLNEKIKLENIKNNVDDLREGYLMVCHVLTAVFEQLHHFK